MLLRREGRGMADLFHHLGDFLRLVEDVDLRAAVRAAPAILLPAFFVHDQSARRARVGGVACFDLPLADAADLIRLRGDLGRRRELDRSPAFLALPASADELL